MWLRRLFQALRLAADIRGASAVEFAAITPVLVVLVLGISDLGYGFTQRLSLNQAANRTLELAHLGAEGEDFSHLVPEAAAAAGVPEKDVMLEQWLECDGVQRAWTDSCAPGQKVARYVKLTLKSDFDPFFPTFGYLKTTANGAVEINANASLRVQ